MSTRRPTVKLDDAWIATAPIGSGGVFWCAWLRQAPSPLLWTPPALHGCAESEDAADTAARAAVARGCRLRRRAPIIARLDASFATRAAPILGTTPDPARGQWKYGVGASDEELLRRMAEIEANIREIESRPRPPPRVVPPGIRADPALFAAWQTFVLPSSFTADDVARAAHAYAGRSALHPLRGNDETRQRFADAAVSLLLNYLESCSRDGSPNKES